MKAKLQALRALSLRNVAVAASATLMSAAAMAQTTGPFDQFFDAIDLSGISAKVIATGVLLVGIALAFKGPDIAKRLVRKV